MPSPADIERAKAFRDFYGPQPQLLEDGSGTLLGKPLVVARFVEDSKYAILRTHPAEKRRRADTWEMVEFALPREKQDPLDVVRRAKVHQEINSANIIAALAIEFTKPDGVVRFAVERRDDESTYSRILPHKSDLSCAVYSRSERGLMLAWIGYDNGFPNQVSFTQLSPDQVSQGQWGPQIENHRIPQGLTVFHKGEAAELYKDPVEPEEEYEKLGLIPRGAPFEHPQLDVKVSYSLFRRGDRLTSTIRAVDKQGRPHILLSVPRIDRQWYYDAQGSSEQFANMGDHYPFGFIHGNSNR